MSLKEKNRTYRLVIEFGDICKAKASHLYKGSDGSSQNLPQEIYLDIGCIIHDLTHFLITIVVEDYPYHFEHVGLENLPHDMWMVESHFSSSCISNTSKEDHQM